MFEAWCSRALKSLTFLYFISGLKKEVFRVEFKEKKCKYYKKSFAIQLFFLILRSDLCLSVVWF